MLQEQKIYGSQFLTDCSPKAFEDLLHNFSLFLKKLHLPPPTQLAWQNIFKESFNKLLSKPTILPFNKEEIYEGPKSTRTYMRIPIKFLAQLKIKKRRLSKKSNITSSDKLITSWTLRGNQICLEFFHPSPPFPKTNYLHENTLSSYGKRQIISKTYNNLHNNISPQSTIYELEIASEFQKKILPLPSLPENNRWNLFTQRKSSLNVAGDYADAHQTKNGDLFLITADAMGKGITAAFLATIIHTAFNINLESNISPTDLIHALNHTIIRETKNLTIFATCTIAFIPFSCNYIEIINAAHCPPLLFDNSNLIHQFLPSGPPLGLFDNPQYTSETLPLTKSQQLIMLTDGLYEWKYNNHSWGWQNLLKFISQHLSSPEHLWEALQHQIEKHSSPNGLTDDQTILLWTQKK